MLSSPNLVAQSLMPQLRAEPGPRQVTSAVEHDDYIVNVLYERYASLYFWGVRAAHKLQVCPKWLSLHSKHIYWKY